MKACMVAYTHYDWDNRVRRYAETLVKEGWEVEAITLKATGQPTFEMIRGVKVIRIQERKTNEKGKLRYFVRMLRFLILSASVLAARGIKKRYHLIHVHSIPDFEVFAAIIPKVLGTKVILDIHDIVPELFLSKFGATQDSILFRMLILAERFSTAFSDHVIIANNIWREKLINRSIRSDKCTAIMNYPVSDIFTETGQTREDGKFVAVYPGSLSKHQGIETAIRAVNLLRDHIPNLEFHIYGEGTDENYFRNLISDLKLEDRVVMKGSVALEQIPLIMADADLGIEPKLKNAFSNEAFSTKIFEFMMVGVPLVVSDTLVHRYYIPDTLVKYYESGNEYELAEAIKLLYDNPDIRIRYVRQSGEFIIRNCWDTKKHLYLDIIRQLLSSPATTRQMKKSSS
ncbi:MAG: glycosyltransferase [Chitinivibrionales bacterium]|nr:glycosyltransferase [Chitinivibrionales bacterium]